jgi:uncharacterized membrane protein
MREFALITHFIGLAMGLGTSIGFIFLGIAGAKLEPEERKKFMTNVFILSNMGKIGIVLLVLSGGYLLGSSWSMLGEMPLFVAKLILVLVLITLVVIINTINARAQKGKGLANLKYIRPLGMISVLIGIAIVSLAVIAFE